MAAEALEQSMLESKDKEQLLAIAQALGIKTTARAAKATLIDKILETTGGGDGAAPAAAPPTNGRAARATKDAPPTAVAPDKESTEDRPAPAPAGSDDASPAAAAPTTPAGSSEPEVILGPDGEPLADWEIELIKSGEVAVTELVVSPASSGATGARHINAGITPARARSAPRRRRRARPRSGGRDDR